MIQVSTLFIFVALLGFIGLVFFHEAVHMVIFSTYGIESHIEIQFPHVATVPEGNYSLCTANCELAHNINEAVSYPMVAFYFLFSFGLLAIIMLQELQYAKS
jgi:hypothetical protein